MKGQNFKAQPPKPNVVSNPLSALVGGAIHPNALAPLVAFPGERLLPGGALGHQSLVAMQAMQQQELLAWQAMAQMNGASWHANFFAEPSRTLRQESIKRAIREADGDIFEVWIVDSEPAQTYYEWLEEVGL